MSLSPETRERLVEAMAKAMHEATNGPGSWPTLTPSGRRAFRKGILATRNSARAALAVVLDDPQVTVIEGGTVEQEIEWNGVDGTDRKVVAQRVVGPWRPVSPENETSTDGKQ